MKHYLACCSRDATGKETTLTVKIASEEFKATGLMVIERNWLEIYSPWERWSTGGLAFGDMFCLQSLRIFFSML